MHTNKHIKRLALAIHALAFITLGTFGSNQQGNWQPQPPKEKYGALFTQILLNDSLFGPGRYFVESKDFLDRIPVRDLSFITQDYNHLYPKDLKAICSFLDQNFRKQTLLATEFKDSSDIDTHINMLWDYLTRHSNDEGSKGTLIPLKKNYVVPGGRFQEIYYWDSYFTMLGLLADYKVDLAEDMTDNFAELIREIGFIPNGNRTYYLGRSQPPFFSYMVEALAEKQHNKNILVHYLPEMLIEYSFWMRGSDKLTNIRKQIERCVKMPNGVVLNRYYDEYDTPREEMYRNDLETGKNLLKRFPHTDIHSLYRNLRAGAESGWDFSSRWLKNDTDLSTISTTDFVTVDLNCLIYHLEQTIAKAAMLKGNKGEAILFNNKARKRSEAIVKYMWDENKGAFYDWNWRISSRSDRLTAATCFPLFAGIANHHQAKATTEMIVKNLLKQGGIVTTTVFSGQQWDAPNGWAPLQWVTYKAFLNYSMKNEAEALKRRWMNMVENVYEHTHKLLEKYNVITLSDTGGGEYKNQDGFGWTNGVYRAMKTYKP